MRLIVAALIVILFLPLVAAAQLRIAVSIDSLVIPVSKVGFSRQGLLRLSNISSTPVDITSITIVPFFAQQFEFDIYSPALTTFTLDSGESITIIILFSPQTPGFHSAALLIETPEGTQEVKLYGDGILLNPDIVITPDTIDFGTLEPGHYKDSTFYLESGGKDAATIDFFEVANDNGAVAYSVSPDDPRILFPLDIQGKDSAKFTVRFSAFGPNGARTGRVTMEGLATGGTVCEFRGRVGWPDLEFRPQVIDLGILPLGSSADTFTWLVSTGEFPITITSFDPPPSPYTIYSIPNLPIKIAPSDSIKINIHFDAVSAGDFNRQFTAHAEPVSVYLLSSTAFLRASVVPRVLSQTPPQPFRISCAIDSVYKQTLSIFDTGQYPISVSGLFSSDPRFHIAYPGLLPDTLLPGMSRDIAISFHDTSAISDTSCIFNIISNGRAIITDTISVMTFADHATCGIVPIISKVKTSYANEAGIISMSDLSRFGLHALAMNITIDPSDLAEIDTSNVKIDNNIFPNATISIGYDPASKIYHSLLQSTSTLPASAANPFLHLPLHYFVAKDTSAVLHISISAPEKEGCLSFSDDSIPISASGGCGDPEIRNLLNDAPLISDFIVVPNPSASTATKIIFTGANNMNLSAIVTDCNGKIIYESAAKKYERGVNEIPLNINSLSSGVYSVRLSAYSPPGNSQNIFRTFILTH